MSRKAVSEGILHHFAPMEDPRIVGMSRHRLLDIIAIVICGVLSNADGWEDIEEWAEANEEWLKTWLELPHGIPSHDTIRRVFVMIDPESFAACFLSWVEAVGRAASGRLVSIDGKTLRGSHDSRNGKAAIHMVSAWEQNNGMVLGQLKTDAKSNEITAIPQLLDMLDLDGVVVTIDAMGCQKAIAEKILGGGGDYVLALKDNHRKLRQEAAELFTEIEGTQFNDVKKKHYKTVDKTHGRTVEREYTLAEQAWQDGPQKGWPSLRCFGRVQSRRTVDGETKEETRYYITSLPCKVKLFADCVRRHWSIENHLHWALDVSFREDESRIRTGHAAENLSTIRRLCLAMLKREKSSKRGIAAKRRKAGWDRDYLLKVLEAN